MPIDALRAIHLLKKGRDSAALAEGTARLEPALAGALKIDTCQRVLWLYRGELVGDIADAEIGESAVKLGAQVYRGADAYRFMLRFATGLESEVMGETDVFGQLKDAWGVYAGPSRAGLAPWIQRVFEDTKEIRSLYLQNTGGGSYGSLVRKLIRDHSTGLHEAVLLVGAGHIALSVGPWLTEREIWILNRTQSSARRLAEELRAKDPAARVRVLDPELDEESAWREASHAVICVPVLGPDASQAERDKDLRRMLIWKDAIPRAGSRSVIHLGGLRAQCGEWAQLPNFHPLDDLFALQKTQEGSRGEQFARALKACEDKSKLRAYPGPHGWEDLDAFEGIR